VLILNPNHRKVAGHSERHCVAAWDAFVTPSAAQHIVMVAHSYGGVCTAALLGSRREAVTARLRAVALTDSVHGRSVERLPPAQREFFARRCVNWVTSDKPLDTLVRTAVHDPPPGTDGPAAGAAAGGGGAKEEEKAQASESESGSAEVLSEDDDDSASDALPAAAPAKRCVTRARALRACLPCALAACGMLAGACSACADAAACRACSRAPCVRCAAQAPRLLVAALVRRGARVGGRARARVNQRGVPPLRMCVPPRCAARCWLGAAR
jgi:pimeloyl-ACP methyl ester carboxylesterase